MIFSIEWLKQLVDFKQTPKQLAEILSEKAFETEIAKSDAAPGNIVVAEVLKVEKHPNADRLRVVELSVGEKIVAPVVCGAWNFEVGAKVPLALPGALIPHDQHDPEGKPFVLEKAVIRGIESQGMICSGKELGVSSDGSGILVLDGSRKPGEPFDLSLAKTSSAFDISVPANRPDLISYRGVAWEIAALTGAKYKATKAKFDYKKLPSKIIKVRVTEPALCSRYIAVRLNNVEVGPSPKFVQERLKASGQRPINNIVDITNYVMLETGQPLHAFDGNKVVGGITVRKAYLNETLTTLDNVLRKLTKEMLVIADDKKALAVAGVMGGTESAVSNSTTQIVLESANFNSVSVRRTARELGIRTDASARFEKSLPPALTGSAINYAIELLMAHAKAKPLDAKIVSAKPTIFPAISVDCEDVNRLLGTSIKSAAQKNILKKFGFEVSGDKILKVRKPFWRTDVSIWQDLAEEVGRFEGLDKIQAVHSNVYPSSMLDDKPALLRENISDVLIGLGFDEIYTYSFVSKEDLEKWQISRMGVAEIANPLSQDQQYLRPNLLINNLKIALANSRLKTAGRYFEFGRVFNSNSGLVDEKYHLSLFTFNKSSYESEFLTASIKTMSDRFGLNLNLDQTGEQAAAIKSGSEIVGKIEAVNRSELKCLAAVFDFEKLHDLVEPKLFTPIIKYPSKELDVAAVVSKDLVWEKIESLVLKIDPLVRGVTLFDIYTGSNIPRTQKSLAFRIIFQSPERTLKDEEVNKIHAKILSEMKAKFNADIR
jgi:phenylalanyl-tRNA synthetase beta chain